MTEAINCFMCDGPMEVTFEDRRYEDDLNVIIKDTEVRRCGNCGEEEIVFPAIERMHKAIAKLLAQKPGRFQPAEIRFLRTYLGYSGVDFAGVMAVSPETVSRWERKDGRYPIGTTSERALRFMALCGKRVRSYGLEHTGIENRLDDMLMLDEVDGQWMPIAATC